MPFKTLQFMDFAYIWTMKKRILLTLAAVISAALSQSLPAQPSSMFTVNKGLFSFMRSIGDRIPYQGFTSNCVNWASMCLWLNGIPNVGIHPFILHGTMFVYNSGLYNVLSYKLQNSYAL